MFPIKYFSSVSNLIFCLEEAGLRVYNLNHFQCTTSTNILSKKYTKKCRKAFSYVTGSNKRKNRFISHDITLTYHYRYYQNTRLSEHKDLLLRARHLYLPVGTGAILCTLFFTISQTASFNLSTLLSFSRSVSFSRRFFFNFFFCIFIKLRGAHDIRINRDSVTVGLLK